MKLIDTDVLIDHFHGHQAALNFLAHQLTSGEAVAISVVTITEILTGMRPGEEQQTEKLLSLFKVLDVDEATSRQAGLYLRQFRKSHKLELGDALIAASAKLNGADIVTRNVKHYPMSDVSVVAPYQRGRRK